MFSRHGFLLIVHGSVVPCRDFDDLVVELARARDEGRRRVEARVCTASRRDRALTAAECSELIAATTALIAA